MGIDLCTGWIANIWHLSVVLSRWGFTGIIPHYFKTQDVKKPVAAHKDMISFSDE